MTRSLLQKKFLLILIITSSIMGFANANANDEYKYIYPIHNCSKFYFKYKYIDNNFKLTYPISNTNGVDQFAPSIYVKDISDLSQLTDIVNEYGAKMCEPPYGISGTLKDCKIASNLTPEFIRLNRTLIDIIKGDVNYCENITPLLELQDKIEGLSSLEGLLELESSFSFLKLFVDDSKDELIDHYESCGGEEFSNKFIENMILITARDACIMPSPPGFLSWDESKLIASKISSSYKNMSIGKISDKIGEISKNSYLEFTKLATSKQVTDLLGESADSISMVENLDSFKTLTSVKSKHIADYITDVYQVNATLELASKAFPDLLWEKSKDKLPQNFNREMFNQLILPSAQNEFDSCLEKPKQNLGFPVNKNISKEIRKRKSLKKAYCLKHKTCQNDSTDKCSFPEINIMSDNPEINDTEVVMGCAYSGFLSAIKKILPEIIKTKMSDLSSEELAQLSEMGWKELSSCFNQDDNLQKRYIEMKEVLYPIEGEKRNYRALQGMSIEDFESSLLGCAAKAETSLSEHYVTQTIKSHPTVKAYFPQNSQALADSVINETFRPCISFQENLVQNAKLKSVDPNFCRPLIEMNIGSKVIQKSLKDIFDQYDISELQQSKTTFDKFASCYENSSLNAYQAIGSQISTYEIKDVESSVSYLENNPEFVNCIKSAMIDTSVIVSGREFEAMLASQKERLTTYDSILEYKPKVMEVAKKCFKDNLDKVEGYSAFLKWNEQSGIESLKAKCEMEVKKFILPKILTSEAYPQLKEIEKIGLLGTKPVNILAQVAQEMLGVKAFPAESPQNDKTHWTLGKAYEKYSRENPASGLDDFISQFQDLTEKRVVEQLHETFFKKLDELGKRYGESYPELKEVMGPGCFLELKDSLMGFGGDSSGNVSLHQSSELDSIIELVSNGLHYLKRRGEKHYQEQVSKFKSICDNPKRFKGTSDLMSTGVLDFIVYQKVQESVVEKFKALAEDNYNDEILLHSRLNFFSQKKPFIKMKKEQMLKLIEMKLEDPSSFHDIVFSGGNRKIESFALNNINELLNSKSGKAFQDLNIMITEKLFDDQSINSFSSEFTRIQLVNNLGISGYDQAFRSVVASSEAEGWYLDDSIKQVGVPELNRQWTPANIENMIAWNTIDDTERIKLQTSLYKNVIYPSATGASASDIDKGTELVKRDLTNFTQSYQYEVTYKYDSGDTKIEKVSFQDRLAQRIKSHVEKNVGTWDAVKEAWEDLY